MRGSMPDMLHISVKGQVKHNVVASIVRKLLVYGDPDISSELSPTPANKTVVCKTPATSGRERETEDIIITQINTVWLFV